MRHMVGLVAVAILATGCVGVATEGARGAASQVVYDQNIGKARQGDREAQFKVGEALCCGVDDRGGFYNTRQSVTWLCLSAAQGYAPAMHKLGRIYSGDTVDGVRVIRRVAGAVAGTATNLPVSYAWFANAKAYGMSDADKGAQDVWKDMSPAQQQAATRLAENGLKATCDWDQAIQGRR
jgi:TPR repeat protein